MEGGEVGRGAGNLIGGGFDDVDVSRICIAGVDDLGGVGRPSSVVDVESTLPVGELLGLAGGDGQGVGRIGWLEAESVKVHAEMTLSEDVGNGAAVSGCDELGVGTLQQESLLRSLEVYSTHLHFAGCVSGLRGVDHLTTGAIPIEIPHAEQTRLGVAAVRINDPQGLSPICGREVADGLSVRRPPGRVVGVDETMCSGRHGNGLR